jgi:membrane-associated HD superfamily phosphohydrolase
MESTLSSRSSSRRNFLPLLVLACISILAYIAIVQPWSLRQISLSLSVGDVAPQDLRAPHDAQYVSEVLTDAARANAERAVDPVYNPPDASVARTQSGKLDAILTAISAIRTDQLATNEQKITGLLAIQDLSLQPSSQQYLLALTDTRWQAVKAEAFKLLGQAMQNPVRTDDLESVRQKLPSLVSLTLSEKENALVVEIVAPLIVANSYYSPELTEAARQAARDDVQPVTRSFISGQTVLTRGQVITAADLEALTVLGLVQPINPTYNYLGAAALVVLAALFIVL